MLRQNPLNILQVALKNNVGVFYFSTNVPPHVLLSTDGKMDKKVFLATWKDIPAANEVTTSLTDIKMSSGKLYSLMSCMAMMCIQML